jgi:hypothetical protein
MGETSVSCLGDPSEGWGNNTRSELGELSCEGGVGVDA